MPATSERVRHSGGYVRAFLRVLSWITIAMEAGFQIQPRTSRFIHDAIGIWSNAIEICSDANPVHFPIKSRLFPAKFTQIFYRDSRSRYANFLLSCSVCLRHCQIGNIWPILVICFHKNNKPFLWILLNAVTLNFDFETSKSNCTSSLPDAYMSHVRSWFVKWF